MAPVKLKDVSRGKNNAMFNPDCAVASNCAFRCGFLRLATDSTAQSGLKTGNPPVGVGQHETWLPENIGMSVFIRAFPIYAHFLLSRQEGSINILFPHFPRIHHSKIPTASEVN
jgi:hypothetical protein